MTITGCFMPLTCFGPRDHGSGWLLLLLLPELLDLLLGGLGLVRLVGLGLARPDHLPHAANLRGSEYYLV